MKNFEIKITFSTENKTLVKHSIELTKGDPHEIEEDFDRIFKGELLRKTALLYWLEVICHLEKEQCTDIMSESIDDISSNIKEYLKEDDNA